MTRIVDEINRIVKSAAVQPQELGLSPQQLGLKAIDYFGGNQEEIARKELGYDNDYRRYHDEENRRRREAIENRQASIRWSQNRQMPGGPAHISDLGRWNAQMRSRQMSQKNRQNFNNAWARYGGYVSRPRHVASPSSTPAPGQTRLQDFKSTKIMNAANNRKPAAPSKPAFDFRREAASLLRSYGADKNRATAQRGQYSNDMVRGMYSQFRDIRDNPGKYSVAQQKKILDDWKKNISSFRMGQQKG